MYLLKLNRRGDGPRVPLAMPRADPAAL